MRRAGLAGGFYSYDAPAGPDAVDRPRAVVNSPGQACRIHTFGPPPHHNRPPPSFRRRDQSAEGPQHATQRGGSKTRARAGDSFTHCDQVSDGETWQEFLASHIREPVKNFGVGEPS